VKGAKLRRFEPAQTGGGAGEPKPVFELDCGGPMPGGRQHDPKALLGSTDPQRVAERFGRAWELPLNAAERVRVPVALPAGQQVVGLLVAAGATAKPGKAQRLHLVQRHRKSGQIVGGVAIELRVIDKREKLRDG
jgi:hypothetical protein